MEAVEAGVTRFLLPNIDVDSLSVMIELCNLHPSMCFPMFGLHPCYVKEDYKSQLETIKQAYSGYSGVKAAIGEIGLDFYWELTFKQQQIEAFRDQVIWAHQEKLPVSIHSRESTAEILTILRELRLPGIKGVLHCFSGDINQADEAMNLGFLLGIGGVVTFKKSTLGEIVKEVPMEFIILETDGPYLAPTPYRGKRNNPAYLKLIADKVAEIKNLEPHQVSEITTSNALKLFGNIV